MKQERIGKKVILREQRPADASFFAHWYNDPTVMFQCGFTEKTTLEAERKRIEQAPAPENQD